MKIIPITQWSSSKYKVFGECKFRAQLQFGQKIPEPERPLPPGKTEHANDRGTRIHNAAEMYVQGKGPLIAEMMKFEPEFKSMRQLYIDGMVSLEGEWAMDRNWEPVEWKSKEAWLRLKLDSIVFLSKTEAVVIDYKGLPLNTMLPTPKGWVTMKNINVGDQLIDRAGNPCNVVGKSEVKSLPCYQITFDDTSTVICDEDHLWTLADGTVKGVQQLNAGDFVPTAEPAQLPEQDLPLDPYVLGIWLADGKHTSGEITKPDAAIWEEIERRGFKLSHNYSAGKNHCRCHSVYGLRTAIRKLGLLGDKQIPQRYLRGSYQQRLDLLHGIMDGDGSANHTRKQAVLTTTRLDFAQQVKELLLSLGQRPLLSPYIAHGFGKDVQAYAVSFRPRDMNPFLLARKADKVLLTWGAGESWRRRVKSVELVPSVQTQCVAVDSPDNTFLCTENFIPTHNSGKRFGNEISHAEQTQLYQLVSFLRYSDLEIIHTELWYLDVDELICNTFTRRQGLRFMNSFDKKGRAITGCVEFPATPSLWTCKYCPYGPRGTAHCDKGV